MKMKKLKPNLPKMKMPKPKLSVPKKGSVKIDKNSVHWSAEGDASCQPDDLRPICAEYQ